MGRPSALSDRKAKDIIDATLAGVHVEVAAARAGINKGTYYLWQAKGKVDLEARAERDDLPEIDASHSHEWESVGVGPALRQGMLCWCGHTRYSDFVDRLLVAEAQAESRIVAKVQGAFDADPRLALYFMERRWPKRWARRDKLAISHDEEATDATPVVQEPIESRLAKTLAILDRAGRLPSNDSET